MGTDYVEWSDDRVVQVNGVTGWIRIVVEPLFLCSSEDKVFYCLLRRDVYEF